MFTGVLSLLCSVVSANAPGEPFSFFAPLNPKRSISIVAVSESKPAVPPNSLAFLKFAIEDYLEWVEIDVRETKDGFLVVAGDDLRGATGEKLRVAAMTTAELQGIEIGEPFAGRFPAERVPSLRDALQVAKGKINLLLECRGLSPTQLIEDIRSAKMDSQVLVHGEPTFLDAVSQGNISVLRPESDANKSAKDRTVVGFDCDEITPEKVNKWHAAGLKVFAYEPGKHPGESQWDRAMAAGADFLRTYTGREAVAHFAFKDQETRAMQFSIHRGALRYVPENTIPAVEKTIALGADFVELDIRTANDGKLFIMHDAKVDRTTNGTGPIARMDSSAIGKLDAGVKFGSAFTGLPVPTFEECLDVAKGKIDIYIDAKNLTPEALIDVMRKYDLLERSVVYQGPAFLAKLKEIEPQVKTLTPLVATPAIDALAKGLKPYGVDVPWRLVSKDLIDRCHARGIKVFSDVADEMTVEECLRAMDWGIDVMQTDRPMTIIRAFEVQAAKGKKS